MATLLLQQMAVRGKEVSFRIEKDKIGELRADECIRARRPSFSTMCGGNQFYNRMFRIAAIASMMTTFMCLFHREMQVP
eukprot:2922184-Amphidinium_carterae.1